jgi:hypothetical protein
MYLPKDIHHRLKFEAKLADHSKCYSWSRLFRQASYALKKKDREIEKLKAEAKKGTANAET